MFTWTDRRKLEEIFQLCKLILKKEIEMAGELDALETQVAATTDAEQSAIVLLQSLAQKLQDAINSGNPARIQAVTDALKAKTDALAAAVVAGTPAENPTP